MPRDGRQFSIYFPTRDLGDVDEFMERENARLKREGGALQYNRSSWIRMLTLHALVTWAIPRLITDQDVIGACDSCGRDITHGEEYSYGDDVQICCDCSPPFTDEEKDAMRRERLTSDDARFGVEALDVDDCCMWFGATVDDAVSMMVEEACSRDELADDLRKNPIVDITVSTGHAMLYEDYIPDVTRDVEDGVAEGVYVETAEQLSLGKILNSTQAKELDGLVRNTIARYLKGAGLEAVPNWTQPGRVVVKGKIRITDPSGEGFEWVEREDTPPRQYGWE